MCEKKKRIFRKTFHCIQIFLELQRSVDDLVKFLELSMFMDAFLS